MALTFVPFADEDSRGPRACSSHNKRVKTQGLSPTLPKAYPHMLLRSRERMNRRSPVWSRLPSEHQGLPSNHIITGPLRTCSGPHLCLCGAPRARGKFPLCISISAIPSSGFPEFAIHLKGRILFPCKLERGKRN